MAALTRVPTRDPRTGKFQTSAAVQQDAVDQRAFDRAVGAVAKAFLSGNAATMMNRGPTGPQRPGTSWSNQGGTSSALIARVTANLAQSFGRAPEQLEVALASQGLSWGPPFPPGRPLDPFWGYRRPPRQWDFSVGENVQLIPRWDRVSFQTIEAVYNAYDIAQICVRRLINNVVSLDYTWLPADGVLQDVSDEVEAAAVFWSLPDRREGLRAFVAEYLQDVLRYDAGCLYLRRDEGGRVIAVEVVDGTTMIPLIDIYGRVPADEDDQHAPPAGQPFPAQVTPAYLQIIEGMPWDWLTADDIVYQPWYPLPNSQYGVSPLESVLMTANTDLRFQSHFLEYFTRGSLPAGLMEAPPDQSDPDSLREWQESWDALMLGDQAKLRQIRWVPAGAKFTPSKNSDFDPNFPLYLLRRVIASYGMTPNDLGFTEDVNRATGDTQIDVQYRVGIVPILKHVEDVLNFITRHHLGLRARIKFDDGREIEDRVATAQAHQIYVRAGVESTDEVRMRLGLPTNRLRPTPRFIDNTRSGPVPLVALESIAGKTDPMTFGPAKDQPVISQSFVPAPGVLPVIESDEYHGAMDTTAAMQRGLIEQATGKPSPMLIAQPTGPVAPWLVPTAQAAQTAHDPGDGARAAARRAGARKDHPRKGLADEADPWAIVGQLLDRLEAAKSGGSSSGGGPGLTGGPAGTGPAPIRAGAPDNTGGPGVTRAAPSPTTIRDGLMVDTGLQGDDLIQGPTVRRLPRTFDADEDEADEDEAASWAAKQVTLRRWRENARNRLRAGRPVRRFADVDVEVGDLVWGQLQHATTPAAVDQAFKAAEEALAPKA